MKALGKFMCPACGGVGKVKNKKCKLCDGQGRVNENVLRKRAGKMKKAIYKTTLGVEG